MCLNLVTLSSQIGTRFMASFVIAMINHLIDTFFGKCPQPALEGRNMHGKTWPGLTERC